MPMLSVRVGDSIEDTLLISPFIMRSLVVDVLREFELKVELNRFRVYNPMIFWNLIWHFQYLELPYHFLLPYAETIS
jgi:hypothetical protein|eukprot:CAMPEP_0168313792 /NCGR_PEP_ID=MMETSP0210-20121227/4492_1 /TAXON_ID=40633 /ORGANISM="Condylostoma magnum, Strain COL2" /LENGTH=76 /DNA_ID=CAMNT_0008275097 /DNA_START=3447 /DNA_END=3677 /DNA_ORIENTATION=-